MQKTKKSKKFTERIEKKEKMREIKSEAIFCVRREEMGKRENDKEIRRKNERMSDKRDNKGLSKLEKRKYGKK